MTKTYQRGAQLVRSEIEALKVSDAQKLAQIIASLRRKSAIADRASVRAAMEDCADA